MTKILGEERGFFDLYFHINVHHGSTSEHKLKQDIKQEEGVDI